MPAHLSSGAGAKSRFFWAASSDPQAQSTLLSCPFVLSGRRRCAQAGSDVFGAARRGRWGRCANPSVVSVGSLALLFLGLSAHRECQQCPQAQATPCVGLPWRLTRCRLGSRTVPLFPVPFKAERQVRPCTCFLFVLGPWLDCFLVIVRLGQVTEAWPMESIWKAIGALSRPGL